MKKAMKAAAMKKSARKSRRIDLDRAALKRRAEKFGLRQPRRCGRVFILHNGGAIGNEKDHTVEVEVSTEKSYDFGYNEMDYSEESDDLEGGAETSRRRAIDEYGDELQILGVFREKATAKKEAKTATCRPIGKPGRLLTSGEVHTGPVGVVDLAEVPVFGSEWPTANEPLYVVKGATYGQGHGACLLGVYVDRALAEARAAQMIAGVKEVWGDPDYGCENWLDDPDSLLELQEWRSGASSYTVRSCANYDYMEQECLATVERHRWQ